MTCFSVFLSWLLIAWIRAPMFQRPVERTSPKARLSWVEGKMRPLFWERWWKHGLGMPGLFLFSRTKQVKWGPSLIKSPHFPVHWEKWTTTRRRNAKEIHCVCVFIYLGERENSKSRALYIVWVFSFFKSLIWWSCLERKAGDRFHRQHLLSRKASRISASLASLV